MKISVRDIPLKGLVINETFLASAIGLEESGIDLKSKLGIKAKLERVDNFVLAQADVTATYGYTCARCLEVFEVNRLKRFNFDYELTPGLELIDLGDDIRQELILGQQQRVLCKNDCKGICTGCATNLNVEACRCTKK